MAEQGDKIPEFPQRSKKIFVNGYNWRSNLEEEQLFELREEFDIPEEIEMEIVKGGCCDAEGYAGDVTILVSPLNHGLRFPFIRPL